MNKRAVTVLHKIFTPSNITKPMLMIGAVMIGLFQNTHITSPTLDRGALAGGWN